MDKKISHPKAIQQSPVQLTLFQNFYGSDADTHRLSNIVDIWDSTPKYFITRNEMAKLRNNGYLPILERKFEFRDVHYQVKIVPALLSTPNGNVAYYPSSREEIVEDALRKIAVQQNCGFMHRGGEFGVTFTIYQLRKELINRGHGITHPNLIESLMILAGCSIEIIEGSDKAICKTPILASLGAASKTGVHTDRNARWIAYFNPLVANSIMAVNYRQYDYDQVMGYRSQVARWLHKRLANNYTNASMIQPYNILLSTIKRSSHLLNYARTRDQIEMMNLAIEELMEGDRQVLARIEKVSIPGARRNSTKDVKYILYPTPEFIRMVKAANKRQSDGKLKVLEANGGVSALPSR